MSTAPDLVVRNSARQRLDLRMRKLLAALVLSVGCLVIFAGMAPAASASTACQNIAIVHRGTHLVFLWRVVPRHQVVDIVQGKSVIRMVPRRKVHIWRQETQIIDGKHVVKSVPVKVRRVSAVVVQKTECMTPPAASPPAASPTPVTPTPATPTAATPTAATPTAALSINTNCVPSTGGAITLNYSSTNASTCTLSSSPALWSGSDPASVSCSGTYDVTVNSSTSQQQWIFTFTTTNSAGQSATSTQTLAEQAPSFGQSPNWSGYVIPSSSSLITDTSGAFTVPTLDCAATPNAGVATWVGIGGTGSAALLQTGVTTNCVNGAQQNFGWWEEVPSSPNSSVSFTGFPVSAGDVIAASVYQTNSGAWETSVDDLTTGLTGIMVTGEGYGVSTGGSTGSFTYQGLTTSLSYSGGYTAEWIVEDYQQGGIGGSLVPFADYGTVTFTNLTTSLSPWYLTPDEGEEIVQGSAVLSTPSTPSGDGFSVSYTG